MGEPMTQPKKSLFWKAHPGSCHVSDHWAAFAILNDQWKLLTNSDHSRFALYNISQEVSESEDLHGEKPETVTDLLTMLKAWQTTLPDAPFGDVFANSENQINNSSVG
jgi:hypothetical protein